ncbi:MAG: phosphoribosylformylglycinamidine cyclo-ligase [Planctomycetaceae bacterium]|jgi:phosphoribosylformylglycinamidine cyclo-ligase|nr:phosphoribosylformylglycinamidine cyclo-ligase [Planctomycetaceae bacterium]MBT6156659.1 phosphoribosylformylglycinamidine cyclo-ligase [Planctomycetaceae bacterium]MBT6486411.1 phosphoribosylformylglycinamidine cyclo-ligase [Planctomycetaceae bacterium]MBT6494022.1 phosphoribosylformylglycinamidine cyclo-ligase [Planctomycetaceae bacterium]
MNTATYKSAGVDLEKYQQAMRKLPGFLQKTHETQPGRVMELSGGFAGLFRLNGGGNSYHDPVLVSGTDGVGTKIKVAQMAGVYNTIGIDLVAMCVNDCLCLGAEPLFFLDYLAFGRDNPDLIAQLVEGVAEGCTQSKSALLGGETAIMPGLYADDDFDMAGFSVGVVERDRIIDGSEIQPGDVILGLESSGLHSNGFSLIRQAVFDIGGLSLGDIVPEIDKTVGDVLLEPTRIYTEAITAVMQHPRGVVGVNGIAHITGGGLQENIDRILPEGRRAKIDRDRWTVPPLFTWLQELGNIETEEMFRVFNMGIGMAMVVRPLQLDAIVKQLGECGVGTHVIGEIVEG